MATITTRPLCRYMDKLSFVETAQSRLKLRRQGLSLPNSACTANAAEVIAGNLDILTGKAGVQTVGEYYALLLTPAGDEVWHQGLGVRKEHCLPLILLAVCDTFRRLILPFETLPYQLFGLADMTPREALERAGSLKRQHGGCEFCRDQLFGEAQCVNNTLCLLRLVGICICV